MSASEVGALRVSPSRRLGRRFLAGMVVALVAFLVASAVLFVWPSSDRLRPAGAIVSLNGQDENVRLALAESLAKRGYAPVLLISRGAGWASCPDLPRIKVVCFIPHPSRTVGEVDFAARYARKHGITSLIFVAGHAQTTRARLLAHRCFSGQSMVVASAIPWSQMPYQVLYEWGAMLKATLVDRGCS